MLQGEWIDYDGSGQPVGDGVMVDVMTKHEQERDVFTSDPGEAVSWDWRAGLGDCTIVRYKVVENGG